MLASSPAAAEMGRKSSHSTLSVQPPPQLSLTFYISQAGTESEVLMGRGQWPNFFFFGRGQVY
jgi:hypothetical protein